MQTPAELLRYFEHARSLQRAQLWDQLRRERNSSSVSAHIARILKRTRLLGFPFVYGSIIHYLTEQYPPLGQFQVRSKTFWGQKIVIEMRIADLFRTIAKGMPPEIQEVRLVHHFITHGQLTKKDIFYDIGANIGFYSMLAAELGAEVHAFEPVERTFHILEKNLQCYTHTKLNNTALSETNGEVTFYLPPDWSGLSTLVPEMLYKIDRTITVDAITLDTYVFEQGNTPPTVLKIDVEGAELFVLKGGYRTLTHHKPRIIMEVSPPHRNGLTVSAPAIKFLLELGYAMHSINTDGSLIRIESDIPIFLADIDGDFDNVVFLPL